MEKKFTKGPWVIGFGVLNNEPVMGVFPSDYEKGVPTPSICLISPVQDVNIGDCENIKLIAAAPDLLENLERLIDRIEEAGLQSNFPSAYKRAKEAIKKALE